MVPHLILVNVYTPNDLLQQVQFFENVTNKLSKYADERIIIGGDFNCALTASDKVGGRPIENKIYVIDKIANLSSLYSLQDVWREMNAGKKHFTWRDHCAVMLFIQFEVQNKKPRPGFWKFNGSLLEDEVYVKEIKNNIETYRDKYTNFLNAFKTNNKTKSKRRDDTKQSKVG